MAVNENIMVRLTANISDYSAKMQTAAAQTDRLATTIVKPANRMRQFETAATKVGMAVGAMSMAFGVSAVKMFTDFDEAMSEVKANTGATGAELESLKTAALDAGKSTVYNATESANAINELAKAGMSTADVLSGGLSGALNLAASDGMQVADAAELMSSALAQFKLEGKDAGAVADALAAGAAAAQGSASDLGYALSQAGLVANSCGISMQETVGALSLFANTGMIGSDAGTSLKSMLQRLAGPSKEAARTMEELGINAYDASGKFVGLESLAGQLQTRMGGLTQEQRNAAMATIFGSDAVRAANALYEAGADGVAQWTKTVSESGVAAQMAAAKTDNLKGDMEQLGGAIETALIKTGSGANDALRSVVQGVTGMVDAFASLDDGTQQLIVKSGLVVGAFAVLHKTFGDLKNSSSSVGKGLGLALDPIQRLQTALPQLASGFGQVVTAMSSAAQNGDLLAGGMTRGQTAMSGFKQIGSGLFSLMGGPWGLALTAAGTALGVWATNAANAAQRAKELQTSMESGTDAITSMINNMSEMKLGTNAVSEWWTQFKTGAQDVPDLLDKIGISMGTIARAAVGDQQALDEYTAKYRELTDSWSLQDHDRAQALERIFNSEKTAYEESSRLSEQKKDALEQESGASDQATDAASQLTDAMEQQNQSAEKLGEALDDLIKSLFSMEEPALNAAQAQVALDESIRTTVDELTKQGRVLGENGEYLAGMQKQGEDAKKSLFDLAGQAQNTAIKILEEGRATENMDEATKRAGIALDTARDAFVKSAMAAGYSEETAKRLADTYGLTSGETENLRKRMEQLNNTHANPTVDADTEQADKKVEDTKLKLQSLPNGRFMVYGNNEQAMQALAEVVGAKIDPKTGTLNLDKNQYDIALAIANGAKIDPKTGYLLGDNSDMWKKLAAANGWRIDPKTGFIYGNNNQAMRSVKQVQDQKISDKNFSVNAFGASAAEQQIGRLQQMRIGDKSFTVTTYYTSQGEKVHGGTIPKGNAHGGYITGPGTGTSDSIPSMLSNGEYVVNARATSMYRGLLDAINYGNHYAAGGYVQATPAEPYVRRMLEERGRTVYEQTNNFRMYTQGSPRTQADLIAAKIRFRGGTLLGG
ncbi:phage tail tape measure protein [Bifidobacterium animalis]|uniref:Phage tail tape measure protein n=1 Tax=Bifidobacterium animalis subsp. lactis TaxID=302911 RepID=A0A8B3RIY9_BIFAN|nr:phage tail tape measure protein [Bifidobacterium animalis]RYM96127.1 phage tail tape measure protein [Bifidobacterium animalis subsp. lactis]